MEERTNVAFLGRSGSGKSTLANILINGDLSGNNVFQINDSAKGVTDSITYFSNKDFGVIDTIGLGEGKFGTTEHSEAVKIIRNYFSVPNILFNYICYVKKKDKFIDDDSKKFNDFKEAFDDGKSNFVIIITDCEQKWVKKNRETIKEYFGNYPTIGLEILSSSEAIENNIQKFISFVPAINVYYKIGSSGVYYLKGKPKIAKRRLIEGAWCL
ncbi:5177_t:CDS:2, partial [Dentiscutata erythropus]